MTTVAAGVALSPFVYFGAIAGLEIIHPMAVVVLCGLVTSILFNLFVVPDVVSELWHDAGARNALRGR